MFSESRTNTYWRRLACPCMALKTILDALVLAQNAAEVNFRSISAFLQNKARDLPVVVGLDEHVARSQQQGYSTFDNRFSANCGWRVYEWTGNLVWFSKPGLRNCKTANLSAFIQPRLARRARSFWPELATKVKLRQGQMPTAAAPEDGWTHYVSADN